MLEPIVAQPANALPSLVSKSSEIGWGFYQGGLVLAALVTCYALVAIPRGLFVASSSIPPFRVIEALANVVVDRINAT